MATVLIPRTPNWPFRRLAVDGHYSRISRNVMAVQWVLEREFVESGPWSFTLYRHRSPVDLEPLAVSTAVDTYTLEDRSADPGQVGGTLAYSVRLTDGGGTEYRSQVTPVGAYWDHRDWLLAREITRKDNLLLRKRIGIQGWLLKRRSSGDPCPKCLDPITGQVTDPQCPVCYGTGIDGGYYPAFPYWVVMNPSKRFTKLTSDQGLISGNQESCWGPAYPVIDPQDVWVNYRTGDRYRILEDIAEVVRHRGIALRVNLLLDLEPVSSSVYNVPLPADPLRPPC